LIELSSKPNQTTMVRLTILATAIIPLAQAYAPAKLHMTSQSASSRRSFVSQAVAFTLGTTTASFAGTRINTDQLSAGGTANAVGPIKINIINPTYTAAPCPPSKPIPGEKAMKGMRGLCVQVKAELDEMTPKVSN
jgi:hypothetical protein